MKISPEAIILNEKILKSPQNIFLVSGNEESYIKKIQRVLEKKLYNHGYKDKYTFQKLEVNSAPKDHEAGNLFSQLVITIHENPKEIDLKYLDEINSNKLPIIFVFTGLKNSSKIKKYFDNHKNFLSISCYVLTKKIKKIFFDDFLKTKNLILENSAYWFFLEHSDDRYLIFENELKKLANLNQKNTTLKEVQALMSSYENNNIERVFFAILSSMGDVVKSTSANITSSSDAYFLLQKAKFYLDLSLNFQNSYEAEKNFPKYLFLEKENFLNLYKKLNKQKIMQAFFLIKKTELFLRKHDNLFLLITQRFLLNLKKNLK